MNHPPPHFRGSPRPHASCRVEIKRDFHDGKPESFISYTSDLGTGGVFVIGDTDLVEGEDVVVVLSTPTNWAPLEILAKVCWRKPSADGCAAGHGMEFVSLSDAERIALLELMTSLDFDE